MLKTQKIFLSCTTAIALTMAVPALAADRVATSPHLQIAQAEGGAGEAGPGATGVEAQRIQASAVIGQDLVDMQGDSIGEVEAVIVDEAGDVRAVIVGVGGFLGIGERSVAIDWDQVDAAPAAEEIRTAMTSDQLEALPEYEYGEGRAEGEVFQDPSF